jgi:hypothetical protein
MELATDNDTICDMCVEANYLSDDANIEMGPPKGVDWGSK